MPHEDPTAKVDRLLSAARDGADGAVGELFLVVFRELRELAAGMLHHERQGHTLQPTALVNEAYLRLVGDGDVTWENRAHFFGAAARAIRRILTDHARAKGRIKRGGGDKPLPLCDDAVAAPADETLDLVAVDSALEKLAALDPQKAKVVELRFFAGLTGDQVGLALGISPSSVAREWQFARAWLHREISQGLDA